MRGAVKRVTTTLGWQIRPQVAVDGGLASSRHDHIFIAIAIKVTAVNACVTEAIQQDRTCFYELCIPQIDE